MKKIIFTLLVATAMFFGVAFLQPVFGDRRCERISPYEEICYEGDLYLDKVVRNPDTGSFVDNLSVSDYVFSDEQEVTFRLKIKNTGDEKLSKIEVKDIFPEYSDKVYVTYVSGEGDWNFDEKTLKFEFYDLEPGDTREFEIKGRVILKNEVTGTYCMTNTAEVWSDDKHDKDTAQICVGEEKEEVVEKLPEAGPEDGQTIFVVSTGMLSLGLLFLRKARALRI